MTITFVGGSTLVLTTQREDLRCKVAEWFDSAEPNAVRNFRLDNGATHTLHKDKILYITTPAP